MACLNPNCRSNQHTGVCLADARPKPFPIQPTRLIASPDANAQAQQSHVARMHKRDQDRRDQQNQFQRGQDMRAAQQAQDAQQYPLAVRSQSLNPRIVDGNQPGGLQLQHADGGGFKLRPTDRSQTSPADASQTSPPGTFQMNPMSVRNGPGTKRRDMSQRQDPRVPMLQQQVDSLRSQLQQAQDALNAAVVAAQTPCPACAQPTPPPPCPACPSCPDCGMQLPAGAAATPLATAADVNQFIGQQLAPDYSSNTFVPSTQADFYGLASSDAVAATAADAQSGNPNAQDANAAANQGVASFVVPADNGQSYSADASGQTSAAQAQAPAPAQGLYAIANPGMIRALAPLTPSPTSGISGVCVNCRRPVAVGCMSNAATGAYTCNNCGYAHVGAPQHRPSPRTSGSRARHIVKMHRQGLYTLDQAKAKLKTKVGLNDADIAYALTH